MELFPICEDLFKIAPNLWYSISGTGESPLMRVGHSVVHLNLEKKTQMSNGCLYFIGGANPSGCFNEIYVLNLDNFAWDKMDDLADFDKGRYEHSCFLSKENKVYIFAGANQEETFNSLLCFDFEKKTCDKVEVQSSNQPLSRTIHDGVAFRDQLVIFGGGEAGKDPIKDSKIHIFSPTSKKWASLNIEKNVPCIRHGHVMMNYADKEIYVHGGMNGDGIFDDLWKLDLRTMSWTEVKFNKESPYPESRAAHSGININNNLYIFGGIGSNGLALDDLWKFNIDIQEWSKIEIYGHKPPSRLDFAYCKLTLIKKNTEKDESNEAKKSEGELMNYLVVHGGMDTEGNIFDDCFVIHLE